MGEILDFEEKKNPELSRLLHERFLLIQEKPELAELQSWLDNELAKYGDGSTTESRNNRLVTAAGIMLERVGRLNESLKKLLDLVGSSGGHHNDK